MKDTSGRFGKGSSQSAALQSFLENRLQALLVNTGSTLYQLTSRRAVTPSGRQYLRRHARAHRTSGTDFTGWATPSTADRYHLTRLNDGLLGTQIRQLAPWPTPQARDWKGPQGRAYKGRAQDLASMAMWQIFDQKTGKLGITLAGETGGSVRLNAAHSRFLMGYPKEWDRCAEMAMRAEFTGTGTR
jgi:hypothetical protein